MTKRTGKRLLVAGILAVIVTFPLWLNWICVGKIEGSPRAHYVGGVSRIVGIFGDNESQRKLGDIAERIGNDRVTVEFRNADETEIRALHEKARLLDFGSCLGTFVDTENGIVTFEVDREFEIPFTEAMESFRDEYRKEKKRN